MLSTLFGSKNAERILLFLLVNENCYATEVQKAFDIPLTPLQTIILELEKAGVLTSEMMGKKKLCRLNPSYPLHNELKALLKTAFVHLPPQEKRMLFSRKEQWPLPSQDQIKHKKRIATCLTHFWERLQKVTQVSIETQSAGQAFGNVLVKKENERTLLFTEKGKWEQNLEFGKVLRWSIDYDSGTIGLEHLHYGSNHPVFLFHLMPVSKNRLQSIDSHLCLNDCYFGRIEFNERHIRFLWRILGPRKNEILYHTYN